MYRLGLIIPLAILLVACGGGSSNSSRGVTTASAGPGSPPGQTAPVTVASGQTSTGVSITVTAPVASPPPNAQVLGVGNSASNTGVQIHTGSTNTVFLCGPGLVAGMQVKISGPADIQVNGISTTTCTDQNNNKIAGLTFGATVSSGAALGARTVLLMNPQNDITTFTGGLEVIP